MSTPGYLRGEQDDVFVNLDDYPGVTDSTKLAAACAAASVYGAVVVLPDRVIDVGNGFSMSGYSCGIRGGSAGGASANGTHSTIYASTQTGPVLDFTGFAWGASYRATYEFSNFTVQGSGVADATKANAGIFVNYQTLAGAAVWRNLVIRGTGGPCFSGLGMYFMNFENIKLIAPVLAKTNDVAYFLGQNVSGCLLDLLCYSAGSSADVGVSGAVVLTDNGSFASNQNRLTVRSENLHIPTNGTIVAVAGNDNTIDHQQFDCLQEAAATNTCYTRLDVPAAQNNGGNSVIGIIQGDNGAVPTVSRGVLINQGNNRVVGVKGFKGHNVELASGVGFCYVALQGRHSGATDAAITDNSGQTTNTLLDYNAYPGVGVASSPSRTIAQLGTTASVTNTLTDTTLWTAPTIAAGSLTAGLTKLTIRLGGKYDFLATSGTFSVRVKANGTNLGTFQIAASQTGATTGKGWYVTADLYVDLIGSGGQMSLTGRTDTLVAAGTSWGAAPLNTDATAVNLTAGLTVTVTGVMSIASTSNVLYLMRGVLIQDA